MLIFMSGVLLKVCSWLVGGLFVCLFSFFWLTKVCSWLVSELAMAQWWLLCGKDI